jgi:hypothetical protein
MKSFALELDERAVYSERAVNEQLKRWKRDIAPALDVDHVTLRHWLCDYGHLERTRDGKQYRVGFPAKALAFDVEIYDVDLRATVKAFLAEQERKATEKKAAREALLQDAAPDRAEATEAKE